jgi:hypothetical protein
MRKSVMIPSMKKPPQAEADGGAIFDVDDIVPIRRDGVFDLASTLVQLGIKNVSAR